MTNQELSDLASLTAKHVEAMAKIRRRKTFQISIVWLIAIIGWPVAFFLNWLWKGLGWA